jgi:hypothetical protein
MGVTAGLHAKQCDVFNQNSVYLFNKLVAQCVGNPGQSFLFQLLSFLDLFDPA